MGLDGGAVPHVFTHARGNKSARGNLMQAMCQSRLSFHATERSRVEGASDFSKVWISELVHNDAADFPHSYSRFSCSAGLTPNGSRERSGGKTSALVIYTQKVIFMKLPVGLCIKTRVPQPRST
jgi:hypothetical protein